MPELYIGLMSGTSVDGVDAVLADFGASRPGVIAHCSAPLPAPLKREFLALNASGANELHRAALSANALAQIYAKQVQQLLKNTATDASHVRAIGAHGQTVRHRPGEFDGVGYTLQLNSPALLAELCGIDVVADFRSRDVAAGGQGAPLVPLFHQAFFGQPGRSIAVLNIGGISNVTLLDADPLKPLLGFDCGPGNALMDAWCLQHTGQAYDDRGRWAAGGKVLPDLLADMLDEDFFSKPPPKSTGRDLFNAPWLAQYLLHRNAQAPQDVQATLTELTAQSCANSLRSAFPACESLLVCGGGAFNENLMARLQAALPDLRVSTSERWGLPPLQVEATAFAWLARQTVLRKTGSVQSVTGARGARILGGIYPA
ncbi:MAG: anhydro-N-acetylmuramic acid kinase [Burkholderiales bacterium]|nr:anhydro-N-acetylmuramic acid kinase [Burkholderiales bacterium]